MDVRFGITFVGDDLPTFIRHVRQADDWGIDRIGVGDSQSMYRELYVACTLVATLTKRIRLGPWVTNPVTRHPAVTASAIASVNEVSGGRAFLGIAVGDSAVYNLGLRPASPEALREYVRVVRALLQDGEALYQGKACRLTWARQSIPVYVGAAGRRSLEMAGETADGVFVNAGVLPEVMADVRASLARGAARAGRRVEDIDVWWVVHAHAQDDGRQAREEIKPSLATAAHAAFRRRLDDKGLPPALIEPVQRLLRAYQPRAHVPTAANPNARLVDELGLTDYLQRRFAVVGSPEECAEQVRELAARGARHIWFSVRMPDKEGFLRALEKALLPAFR